MRSGVFEIVLGAGAITAGLIILAFSALGLLIRVLVLAGGLLLVGVSKLSTARRGRHLTPLLRRFGLGMGAVTVVLGVLVLVSAFLAALVEIFPSFAGSFPILVEVADFFTVGLLLIILAAGLVVYGLDRLLEGYAALLPQGQRTALVAVGSASILLAVVTLVFPTFGEALLILILLFALFATGLASLVVGIHRLRSRAVPESPPSPAEVAEAMGLEEGWEPEARLHCLVVASRREIVDSLRHLARRENLKFQQGALRAARLENLDENLLFERLQDYATQFGDLERRDNAEWGAIQQLFEAFQKTAARKKFQWLRPIGTITSKVHVTRIAYLLRKTPIDLVGSGSAFSIGGSLATLGQAVRRSGKPVTEEFVRRVESEFALFKGGLPTKGAYILHIVGLPVDVDSDKLGDIYDDESTVLWDFGASHTEVGALDPADHLMSGTTNFLLGPAILLQHFFDEGRPVALIHKGHEVQAEWAGRRVVTHLSDAIDVELAYKRGEVTLPNPVARDARPGAASAPEALVLRATRDMPDSAGPPDQEEPKDFIGISAEDLRQRGFERIDWDLVRAMMEED